MSSNVVHRLLNTPQTFVYFPAKPEPTREWYNLKELTKSWSGSPIPLQNTLELPVTNLTPQIELLTNGGFFSEELRRSWVIIFGTESANMFLYVPKYSELPLETPFWFCASDFGARRGWKLSNSVFVSVLRPAEVGKSSWKLKISSKR